MLHAAAACEESGARARGFQPQGVYADALDELRRVTRSAPKLDRSPPVGGPRRAPRGVDGVEAARGSGA